MRAMSYSLRVAVPAIGFLLHRQGDRARHGRVLEILDLVVKMHDDNAHVACRENPGQLIELTINHVGDEILKMVRLSEDPQDGLNMILDFIRIVVPKQYEYYRKILIKNSNNIRQYSLGELATLKTGSKPKDVFEFPHKYEYINAGTTNSGYTDKANCDGDTVTTPSRGQGGIGFVGYQYDPFWLGPLCYRIKSRNDKIVTNRYLFYYLSCFNEKILAYKKKGGTPSVNASDLVNIIVDVPPLTEQKRIVAILDRFDALCNDLTSGIPAEIEARQKQYEYYRDKLLTFKELS